MAPESKPSFQYCKLFLIYGGDLFTQSFLPVWKTSCHFHQIWPFPKRQILDSSKLKVFADNNFKVDKNGGKFFKRIENTVG